MKVEHWICLLSYTVFAKCRRTAGSEHLSSASLGDLQDGDSESSARQIFQLRFTTKITARSYGFQVKLIPKVFFLSQKEEGTEPAEAPKYRTAEMLHYPDFTLPASTTGALPSEVLNELDTGSDVSMGTLLLLI